MDDIIKEFLVESYENLDRLDNDFIALEQNPQDHELISSIFRAIHTIKGTCSFFGFVKLERVAHESENLLSNLRDGELQLNEEITDILLTSIDVIRKILYVIESTGNDGDDDYDELVAKLKAANEGKLGDAAATDANQDESKSELNSEASEDDEFDALFDNQGEAKETEEPKEAAKPEVKPEAKPAEKAQNPSNDIAAKKTQITDAAIRVNVKILDKLMNLVGELVLSRNQILQSNANSRDAEVAAASQRLDLITTELQESVMQTRMQPISNVWNKYPRIVRDLSNSVGKSVGLVMEGAETEIDKSIIEAITDPLTHLVRNSIDHGIEKKELRQERGKPEKGTLKLRAYHEGGQVNIEVTDDGGGIDLTKLRNKLIDKGLKTESDLDGMSDHDITNMIMLPGLSTAETVTNISGRGVGMDVVKTHIENIGGMIDIQSKFTEGTTIKIKIPLTLAIIPALLVTCRQQYYAIPQVSLEELVLVGPDKVETDIDWVGDVPVYPLRDKLLPLVFLSKALNLQDEAEAVGEDESNDDDMNVYEKKSMNIVVLQAGDAQFGLVVDSIFETQEIVVKPLSSQIKDIKAYAGATILGDGNVALILDAMGIAQSSRILSNEARAKRLSANVVVEEENIGQVMQLLLLAVGESNLAIPLTAIARLEKYEPSVIESSGGKEVVQYRDHIMPLVRLEQALGVFGGQEAADSEYVNVIVLNHEDRNIGIIIDNIIDVVEESVKEIEEFNRDCIRSTAVISGKVTEIIDVDALIAKADMVAQM